MKFGKLNSIENIIFDLPTDHSSNITFLAKLAAAKSASKLYVGCTGWSMKEWVGTTYPKGTKSKDFLKAYGKQFNTIELNTTHYRIPNAATIQKWYEETPADFRFCPKIPQTISHSKTLGLGTGKIEAFTESIAGLKEKLGCCFIQLPPYFGSDRLAILEQFLAAFPVTIPLAVELRHESWFKNTDSIDTFLSLLRTYQKTAVITDVAGRRDVLHQGISSEKTMIRFVGNGLHPTDYLRIDDWITRLKSWIAAGLQDIYLFPHEPDNILAPVLAEYVVKAAQEQLSIPTRGPKLNAPNAGEQISLF